MEDQYDFEGFQILGYWGIENHTASHNPITSGCGDVLPVRNSHFQEWRERTGKGGDYWIYSDLKQEKVDPPFVFSCPTAGVGR